MAKTKETFETSFTELEQVVAKLQEGGLTLDESVALYERGMALARACGEQLEQAELRVQKLLESGQLAEAESDANG